jgi:hypothetical protein
LDGVLRGHGGFAFADNSLSENLGLLGLQHPGLEVGREVGQVFCDQSRDQVVDLLGMVVHSVPGQELQGGVDAVGILLLHHQVEGTVALLVSDEGAVLGLLVWHGELLELAG